MQLLKKLLTNKFRLVSLGGVATLVLHTGLQYPMYFVADAIASPRNGLESIRSKDTDPNPSRTHSGGNQSFGGAHARWGGPTRSGGQQSSGGARGSCLSDLPLTALAPSEHFGTTISPNPTLWFYLPEIEEGRRDKIVGYFGLLDSQRKLLFDVIEINFPDQGGYIGIPIPENTTLEIGNDYRWAFEFICEEGEPPERVDGWIRRVELESELVTQINQSDQDAYNVYVNNLIWFDVIDYFTRRRIEEPENQRLRQIWSDLLNSEGIGLGDLPSDLELFEYQPE